MRELGPVDVGLIPIWGWGPSLGGGGHLDLMRAAEAVALIEPGLVIPIHWGTYFPIHLGSPGNPASSICRHWSSLEAVKRTAPAVDVRVLRPGESLNL